MPGTEAREDGMRSGLLRFAFGVAEHTPHLSFDPALLRTVLSSADVGPEVCDAFMYLLLFTQNRQ